jgi:hypothetical protein
VCTFVRNAYLTDILESTSYSKCVWRRAVISYVADACVSIRFIDTGSWTDMPLWAVKPLRVEFARLPPLAINCAMIGVFGGTSRVLVYIDRRECA